MALCSRPHNLSRKQSLSRLPPACHTTARPKPLPKWMKPSGKASRRRTVTAVDTNIIVRLLTGDDAAQFQKARQVFASQDIFIPDTVILEAEWVLRVAYKFEPAAINTAFTKLLGLANIRVARPETMAT